MPRIIKFILFIIIFGIVFELGLLSSYTIVTAQPPDVGKLIDMQVSKLTALWDSITGSGKSPVVKTVNVTNVDAVSDALKSRTGLSGINVDSIGAILPSGSTSDTITVTLVAQGYKENQTGSISSKNQSSSGQIVIKNTEIYSITATATAKKRSKGVEVDPNSIVITSQKRLYNQ
ncbi:MAG: hypothetical protein ACXVHW_01800 [Methanobacterium sp.]